MAGLLDGVVESIVSSIKTTLPTRVSASLGSGGGGGSSIGSLPPIQQYYAPSGGGGTPAAPTGGGGGWSPSQPSQGMHMGGGGAAASSIGSLPDIQQKLNMELGMAQSMAFGSARNWGGATLKTHRLADLGTATSQVDAIVAMQQAGLMGMGTGANLGSYMRSAADISNVMPGLGIAEGGQAYASMQGAQNVNMLRAMGVNVRSTGNKVTDFNGIINQIWNMLTNLHGSRPTKMDIDGSLLPGNFLYRFISGYGGNPQMQQAIIQALYAKAGGAKDFSKDEMQRMGITTPELTAQGERFGAQMEKTQSTLDGVTKAFEMTTTVMTGFTKAAADFLNLTGIHEVANLIGATANVGTTLVGGLSSILGSIFGMHRADGGPTQTSKPYIVGERGPELFVPKQNGYIVPNHMLSKDKGGTYGYAEGPAITAVASPGGKIPMPSGADKRQFAKDLLSKIKAPVTDHNLYVLGQWMQTEGGWGNKDKDAAAFNPFNTTLEQGGSWRFNSSNVQNYRTYEEGLTATANTLLHSKKAYKYGRIVNLLRKGAPIKDIQEAIDASSWTGQYEWGGLLPHYKDDLGGWINLRNGSGASGGGRGGSGGGGGGGGGGGQVTSRGSSVVDYSKGQGNWLQQLMGGQQNNWMGGLLGGIESFISSLFGGKRGVGGSVSSSKYYEVGEYGPEMFVPTGGGAHGGGGGTVYHIDKVEISVPATFTEDKILTAFREGTDVKHIQHRARTR